VIVSRRKSRSLFRALLPILVAVWALLPLHRCYLAVAMSAATATPIALQAAGCEHCPPVDGEQEKQVSSVHQCGDLDSRGVELKPLLVDALWIPLSWESPGVESNRLWRLSTPGSMSAALIPARAPLYLRKLALLI
jgi:hypothetical protein